MKVFKVLVTLALWSVANGAIDSLESRIKSSLRGLEKASTHKRDLLARNELARNGKQHTSEKTQYGEAIVDTLGDIVGVDSECDNKKDHYANQVRHADNMIAHWNNVEDSLEVEFHNAVTKTRLCETNINNKFDYYGCNKPTNEAGRIAMGSSLAAIQHNCFESDAYSFLFNGCPRGNSGGHLYKGVMNRAQCEAQCSAASNCVAVEVNGCGSGSAPYGTCHGKCYHFFGSGSIYNGNCVTNGDQQGYQKGGGGSGGGPVWSDRLDGMYILEQHAATNECYDFATARSKCEAASDCHGIATQSNVCGGQFRVTHGTKASTTFFSDWASYNLWAYTLDRSKLSTRDNFEDIKVWMQRIETDSAEIPQQVADWQAKRQTALNSYNEWVKKCSWSNLFSDIANAIAAVAEAIVKVIEDIIKALGCLIIDIALSVVGAVLDGILATVTGGATKTMALTPIGIFICGAPDFAPVSGPVQPGAAPLRAANGVKGLAIPSAMDTLKATTKQQLQGKSLEMALTKSPEIVGAGMLGSGGTAEAGLLSVQATENRSVSMVGFGKQDAFDFLFKFVMAILKEVGKNSCCTALGSFLDDNGDTIDIIQWLMMRAVDAFCGNFGTFIMEIIKQVAFCNLCEICPKDACTLKFLAFRSKCKDYYGGLIEMGATGNLTMGEADSMLLLGNGELGVRTDPVDVQADFHIVSGNPGNQDCNAFCISKGYGYGAIGHDVVSINVGDDDHEVEMYAESPLHSDANGNSPCCPVGNSWGKGTTCAQCKCATEAQANLGAAWSGRLDCMYILEQHLATNECYDFATARSKCEAASDCHGIATQSNVCGGKYRVSHGAKASTTCYGPWKAYNLWAYTVDRSKLPGRACTDTEGGAWNHISGGLKQVGASDDGSKVWGVNSNDDIFFRAGRAGHWIHIGGKLKQISVSGDGSYVWGVNSADQIFYRAGQHGGWVGVGGRLKMVDVAGNGAAATVWGVNSADQIFYRRGVSGDWVHVTGGLSWISVSSDGNHVWGVASNGQVFYRAGVGGSWIHVEGGLRTISVSRDGSSVWGTTAAGIIYQRKGDTTSGWTQVSGGLKDVNVAGDGTSIWGVSNSGDQIFDRTC